MVRLTARILGLVISAIKNIRELKGSTSREIFQYISSIYNISPAVARRQIKNALERGVTYGILKKTGIHYSLPTDNKIALQEVAAQEIGMLDMYCQRKIHRSKGSRIQNKNSKRNRKIVSRCNEKRQRSGENGSRFRKVTRKGRCEDFDRSGHDETTRFRTESTSLDVDKLTDKLAGANQATTGDNVIGDIEQGNRSSMPSEQWDSSIPLSC